MKTSVNVYPKPNAFLRDRDDDAEPRKLFLILFPNCNEQQVRTA